MDNVSKKDQNKAKAAVRNAIRMSFSRSEYYKTFVNQYRLEFPYKTKKGEWAKKPHVKWKCWHCEGLFGSKEFQVDHIQPLGIGLYKSIADADIFYKKVYCPYDNLQILCKPCHKIKGDRDKLEFNDIIF